MIKKNLTLDIEAINKERDTDKNKLEERKSSRSKPSVTNQFSQKSSRTNTKKFIDTKSMMSESQSALPSSRMSV